MASDAAVTSLTVDIQRALQQAVGDANNAATAQLVHAKHHKKSKRQREGEQDHADAEGGGHRKKKKSKKYDGSGGGEPEGVVSAPSLASSTSPEQRNSDETSPASASASGSSEQPTPILEEADATSGKRKKKNKNKGKERAQEDAMPESQPAPVPPPALAPTGFPIDLPASSADFLSAVVAAASATAGQQLQGGPTFDQSMQQFMAYPPEFDPYAYPGPPPPHGHPSGPPPPPTQHPHAPPPGQPFPGAFPDPASILHDLNFGSSEDLLRSLQEFDISKVVTVLKTLGEAAAAANVQLNVPPMFVPGPQPQGPALQPVRSEAILGRPPKQKKGRGAAGQQDVAPVPLQHDNPDHAHMLANVWMSTSKLAELVKTEGKEWYTRAHSLDLQSSPVGLVYKKGKFSATEEAQLNAAIERYRVVGHLMKMITTAQEAHVSTVQRSLRGRARPSDFLE